MPFELKISNVTQQGGFPRVSGTLISGRYFGPEDAQVTLIDGSVFNASIGSMGADGPVNWPMLPEHGSVLHLELLGQPPVRIPIGGILRGVGVLSSPSNGRVLRNDFLELPVFWATHYYLLSADDDHDETELCSALFGLSADEVNDFYTEHFMSTADAKAWPYFRVPVGDSYWVEVEYAEAAEYQVRYKISDSTGPVVTGYESGHFSLPSFRWDELLQIGRGLGSPRGSLLTLLLFPGIYVGRSEAAEAEAVLLQCLCEMNLFESGDRKSLSKNVVANRTVDCHWRLEKPFGWICEGEYAQRNPESRLSVLSSDDYSRISTFFNALENRP